MSRKLALLLLYVVSCFSAGCAVNPITGEEELMFLPNIEQDIEIGRRYAPEVEKALGGRIDNNSLQAYIDRVGRRTARVSHKPNLEYRFVALDHKSVNALALPGGYIFITKGMLQQLQTEAQLAGVLAHEVVHVVARDTANAISNAIGMNMLLFALASAGPSGDVMRAAHVTAQILSLQYSKEDERAADVAGIDYMVRAGYSPYAMVEMMEMLEKRQRDYQVEFLSSHPLHENRIKYMRRRIRVKYQDVEGLKVGREDYAGAVLQHVKE